MSASERSICLANLLESYKNNLYLANKKYHKRWAIYSVVGALLAGNMEEDEVLSSNNVWDSVSVIGDGAKAASSADALRVFLQVQSWSLAVRRLRRRQPPRLAQHLLKNYLFWHLVLN
jgi:hypothetical protein